MADFNVYEGQIWSFNHEQCIADLTDFDTSKWTYSLDLMWVIKTQQLFV